MTTQANKEAANNRRMMRCAGASGYLGLAESTLAKMRMRGDGPAYIKAGKVVLYDPADCDAWLADRRRLSTSQAT
jgi:hypothetical protein